MSRLDEGQGNNADFNDDAFDKVSTWLVDPYSTNSSSSRQLLNYVGMYGDDGPEGPKTLINVKVMQELKYELFNDFQAADKEVCV